ncbi:MAG: PilZ domain-containing protein [Candidatus Aureabacteria bacterium]|nr:PilZ domain-containing protein [Candidatus Auribacterota bacterium]
MINWSEKKKLHGLEKLIQDNEFSLAESECNKLISALKEKSFIPRGFISELFFFRSKIELSKCNYESAFSSFLEAIGYDFNVEENMPFLDKLISKISSLNEMHVQLIKSLIQMGKDTPQVLSLLIKHIDSHWSPYQKYRSAEYKLWCERAFKKFGLRDRFILEELGRCYIVSEEDKIEVYEICRELGSSFTDLLYRAGIVCIRVNRYDIAEKILLSIVREEKAKYLLKPPKMDYHFPAYVALGDICCFVKKGEFIKDGIFYYQEALKLNKKCASLYNRLGDVYRKMEGSQNLEASKDFYLKALEVDSGNTKARYWLGTTFFLKGEYETAFGYFNSISNEKPDFPDINRKIIECSEFIAESYLKKGERDKAKAICQDLLEQDSNNVKAQMILKEIETISVESIDDNHSSLGITDMKRHRRKYPRANTNLNATTKIIREESESLMPERISSKVSNISASGAVIEIPFHKKETVLLGSMTEVELYLPGSRDPVHIKGPVVRFLTSYSGINDSVGFAVNFTDISQFCKEKIIDYVEQHR